MIINAENRVIGRLATQVARKAKEGEEVHIVNSEKAVISGDKKNILADYKQKYERGGRDTGPHFPKRPDKILKRTIRGMLPTNTSDGRDAFSRVKTYLEVPYEFEGDVEELDTKKGRDLKNRNYVTLLEVSEFIGWTPKGDLQ